MKVTLPEASKWVSFQGPSTTAQIGLVAYVESELLAPLGLAGSQPACLDRKVNTAVQAASAVP